MREEGGLMRGIKIPLQDFALKMQGGGGGGGGGLCARGCVFAGHYGIRFSISVVNFYDFCSHIAYIVCPCHPHIESLPTL